MKKVQNGIAKTRSTISLYLERVPIGKKSEKHLSAIMSEFIAFEEAMATIKFKTAEIS